MKAKLPNKKNKSRGFTLIELLVVISIIGLLSSITLASLQSAKRKATGAKIVQEMNQLKNAFELYRSDKGKYPGEIPSGTYNYYAGDEAVSFLKTELVEKKYISSVAYEESFLPFVYYTGYDEGLFYYTCGGRKLKGYLLEFNSDQSLNFSRPGYFQDGVPREDSPAIGEGQANQYCIGE